MRWWALLLAVPALCAAQQPESTTTCEQLSSWAWDFPWPGFPIACAYISVGQAPLELNAVEAAKLTPVYRICRTWPVLDPTTVNVLTYGDPVVLTCAIPQPIDVAPTNLRVKP